MAIVRSPGWEGRLVEVLKRASRTPFDHRSWNCARFAHACAEAVSGRRIPFRRRGGIEESVDRLLPRVPAAYARRGDVVLADVPSPSLGVCLGARSAFVAPGGLLEVASARVRVAWRVD